eukprot:SAG31_NODE_8964_length_1355_cov_4.973726_2_plen_95_part_01
MPLDSSSVFCEWPDSSGTHQADGRSVDENIVTELPTSLVFTSFEKLEQALEAASDSWLTIGSDDGSLTESLSSAGIDFTAWTAQSGLGVSNGGVM